MYALEEKLAAGWPPAAWADVTVLVAVSGGADSVALLRALAMLKAQAGGESRLLAAHFNHRLRADGASGDEAFVVALCSRLGLPCEVGQMRTEAFQPAGEGIEAAARAARYAFLEETAARYGARYVATAHTADDQAETILHRVLRGTGLAGLAGMRPARPLGPAALVRPLLGVRRSEVLAYLAELGQDYRHDTTNDDTRFTRNRIRHDLLPRLAADYNAAAVEALLRLGALAGEAQQVIDTLVDSLAERSVRPGRGDEVLIDGAALAGQPRYLLRELMIAVWRRRQWPMQAMGYAEWDDLAARLAAARDASAAAGKRIFPGSVSAEISDGVLRLRRP